MFLGDLINVLDLSTISSFPLAPWKRIARQVTANLESSLLREGGGRSHDILLSCKINEPITEILFAKYVRENNNYYTE